VAAAQAESVSGDLEANVAAAVFLVETAAGNSARVVVLPELFLTGYDPLGWSDETCLDERVADNPLLIPLREAARAHNAVVVVGAAVREQDSHRTISLLVFDGLGGVRKAYDKQHLTGEERDFFTPGSSGASIVVDGWDLGLGVCYDGCFPEHARAAAEEGALVYVCPSAYYVGSERRRDLYYAARALDNGVYVIFSGLAGKCGDHEFNGGSAVYDPEGSPVDRIADEVPGIVCADLDVGHVRRAREQNPMGADRRPGRVLSNRQRWTIAS
jgi:predicted amidohydrolase